MSVTLDAFPMAVTAGARISFTDGFQSFRPRSGLSHEAVDIHAPEGTLVLSATPGAVLHQWVTKKTPRRTMTGCGWSVAAGYIVLILDPWGYVHYYAHMLNFPLVRSGDQVAAGTPIGRVSNTGDIARTSRPHLHYQVWARSAEMPSVPLTFTRPFGPSQRIFAQLADLADRLQLGATRVSATAVRFD